MRLGGPLPFSSVGPVAQNTTRRTTMTKTRFSLFALTAGLLLAAFASAQDVKTDYDHHANFSQYHTYTWVKVKTSDPLWESRIQEAVDKDLQSKGWQRVDNGADVGLSAVGS